MPAMALERMSAEAPCNASWPRVGAKRCTAACARLFTSGLRCSTSAESAEEGGRAEACRGEPCACLACTRLEGVEGEESRAATAARAAPHTACRSSRQPASSCEKAASLCAPLTPPPCSAAPMPSSLPHTSVQCSMPPVPTTSSCFTVCCSASSSRNQHRRARDRAAVSLIWSSSSAAAFSNAPLAGSRPAGVALCPLDSSTAPMASSTEVRMAVLSARNDSPASSASRGSTRALSGISRPKAETPRPLTSLVVSDSALTKVVCSWGAKALRAGPPLASSTFRVCRMALLTELGCLSPTTLISGPVVLISRGFSTARSASRANSPIASAASSLTVGEAFISACSMRAYRASRDLGRANMGRKNSPWLFRYLSDPRRCLAEEAVEFTQVRTNCTCCMRSPKGTAATSAPSADTTACSKGLSVSATRDKRNFNSTGTYSAKSADDRAKNCSASQQPQRLLSADTSDSICLPSSFIKPCTPSVDTAPMTAAAASLMASKRTHSRSSEAPPCPPCPPCCPRGGEKAPGP
mmetsp:Transcript_37141/g.82495  ORF Transcript_37141/g.82495 Transcript_37141/m.82495 type:complete len:525 (-) Transcript_37141:84-1658(-)